MEPTPPTESTGARAVARAWPLHGVPVPVQREADDAAGEPAERADPPLRFVPPPGPDQGVAQLPRRYGGGDPDADWRDSLRPPDEYMAGWPAGPAARPYDGPEAGRWNGPQARATVVPLSARTTVPLDTGRDTDGDDGPDTDRADDDRWAGTADDAPAESPTTDEDPSTGSWDAAPAAETRTFAEDGTAVDNGTATEYATDADYGSTPGYGPEDTGTAAPDRADERVDLAAALSPAGPADDTTVDDTTIDDPWGAGAPDDTTGDDDTADAPATGAWPEPDLGLGAVDDTDGADHTEETEMIGQLNGTGPLGAGAAQAADTVRGDEAVPLRPGDVPETRLIVWSDDMTDRFRSDWHEVKALFVDEPVEALHRAKSLVTDAVNEVHTALILKQEGMDPLGRSDLPDTETMRVAMRRYREFLDRILAL